MDIERANKLSINILYKMNYLKVDISMTDSESKQSRPNDQQQFKKSYSPAYCR